MRSRQCAHRGRPKTISDCHDKQRHVASASRLCQGRSRLRARRGRLARRHQRRALSRLRLGRRGQRARPRPSASGRGAAPSRRQSSGTCSNLFRMPGRRPACRAAVRADLCRHGVLLQFRRRGDGMRDQDGAPLSRRQGPSRALSPRHLRRRLPRPHAGDHRRRPARQISRRLWPAAGRLRPGAARRSRSGEEGDRAGDRRHHDRAGAGRGRRARRAACILQGAARSSATSTACC